MLFIFTRDFGLVTVVAQGIRHERSKLRYFASDYGMGVFSLVRGRDVWRLTSAQDAPYGRPQRPELIARVALLLRRFLHGEESHPELFECVESLSNFLSGEVALGSEQMKTLESLIVLRVLKILGYVGYDPETDAYAASCSLDPELLDRASTHRVSMNKQINSALRESHL